MPKCDLALHCLSMSHKKDARLTGFALLEKYLNLESFLEKSLKIKYALKSTGRSFKGLEKPLNSSFFPMT